MTFSVAKSYLAILAGLALARGLIRDLDDPVRDYALDDGFESPQNLAITWRHLRPPPQVLRERVMDPIGASDTWEWLRQPELLGRERILSSLST